MPSNVMRFEMLMYISLGVGIVGFVLRIQEFAAQWTPPRAVAALTVGFVIYVYLIWAAARRRVSWARWVLLILFIAELGGLALALAREFFGAPLPAALNAVQLILEAAALYLIFTGDAVAWFGNSHGNGSGR